MKKIILLYLTLISIQAHAQWVQISTIPTTQLNAVKFFDVNTGIAVGVNGVWRTTNSGVNWNQSLVGGNLNAVAFPDINNGYTVGDTGKIYKSIDGGINWNILASGTTSNLYSVSFSSITSGNAAGNGGTMLRTVTGGTSWIPQSIGNVDIYGIVMNTATTGFAVGSIDKEYFISTVNGGTNWNPNLNVPGNSLKSLASLNSLNIVAIGTNGIIRRTSNGGVAWIFPVSGTNLVLNCVSFTDNNTGYIVGDAGKILESMDSGLNWTAQQSSTTSNLKGVSFINGLTGWAVGTSGAVLRTTTGGITFIQQIGNEIPSKFDLSQNYPNPFNPETKIEFSISKESLVSLFIYNVLGGKVAELVNQTLSANRYLVSWNAEQIPSGVYFYILKSDKHSYTKRMVLIK